MEDSARERLDADGLTREEREGEIERKSGEIESERERRERQSARGREKRGRVTEKQKRRGLSLPALSQGWRMAEADGKAGWGRQGALAVGLSQPAGWRSLLSITILFLAWLAGFSSGLFAVIRFESVIHEFDPW